ncbi:PLDc_N domain-containing protein [Agromyces protaetiae]|uniref:PLDc_N domain-containing protein n=1 Tax=Agromyces protaetiae TaxID=2509455 RepID=A0A4P6F851_9MICO|nr:PLD nuclease N-terminal domain-containing protein [Agromyces protaetiae]QAY72270.1 PLDc_N domain-containing protein [Agromyces protaetiae]
MLIRFAIPLLVAAVVFIVYAVVDCALFDRSRIRGIPRGWWIVVILFVPILGAVLWFVIGRGRARPARAGGVGRAPASPDDDPEFLRRLERDSEQDERIRRLEQELADLDSDFDPGLDDGSGHRHPDTPDGDGATGGRPNA